MEKENKMEKRTNKRSFSASCLVVLAAILYIMLPAVVRADCSNPSTTLDADNDGFTEAQECNGITLADGTHFPGFNEIASLGLTERSQYLDPNTKDLFIIVVPLSLGSLMTDASGDLVTDPSPILANVGITAHILMGSSWAAGDRTVAQSGSDQHAAKITEDADNTLKDSKGNYLPFGDSHYGTPNNLDGATVWTQRIKNYVETVACTNAGAPCTDAVSSANGIAAVVNAYITNVMAHEVGHVMELTNISISKYNGNHYAPGSGTVMEQSISYKTSKRDGAVTFTIPQAYAAGDDALTTLK
jgi:hypothetical protein